MKIVKLRSENVLRLVAVEIAPEGNLVTIGGKNGAGKSSVLNSIAMALGGKELVPDEPIRAGETAARIDVDLGDFTVTRKFWREKAECDCQTSVNPETGEVGHVIDCASETDYGETKSALVVTSKDGAVYRSPQAMLEKLYGSLTFDPLAFAHAEPKDQRETLRALVGLDISGHEAARMKAFEERARLKKAHSARVSIVAAMPRHVGLPKDETPVSVVSDELQRAEAYRKLAEEAEKLVGQARGNGGQLDRQRVRLETEAAELRARLADKEAELKRSVKDSEDNAREIDARLITAESARAVVPDVTVIQAKLAEIEATNRKVRQNQTYAAAQAEADTLAKQVAQQDKAVKAAEDAKRKALAAVTFPVAGLGLSEDGVTWSGLPFTQASSSEQLRVSVAIGLALNPSLKVLLVRNGNLLDEDSLAELSAQATAADAQIWMEWVTKDEGAVSVFITDGSSGPRTET